MSNFDLQPEKQDRPDPDRRKTLETLKRRRDRRERPATLKSSKGEYGEMVLCIPELDWAVLMRRFPELNSTDPETHRKAWDWFVSSPYSKPYRTNEGVGRRRDKHGRF